MGVLIETSRTRIGPGDSRARRMVVVLLQRTGPLGWMVLAAPVVLGVVVLISFWPAAPGGAVAGSFRPSPGDHGATQRNDCGAATLYTICRLDRKDYSLSRLRELTKTSSSGTTMLDIKRVAERVGFRVDARNGSWRELQQHVRNPGAYAILHTVGRGGGHFVGVVGAPNKNCLRFADILRGARDFDEDEFHAVYNWAGNMLLLSSIELHGK